LPTPESKWTESSIRTRYGSSYYDNGILDFFDHRREADALNRVLGMRSNLVCLDLAAGNGRFTEAVLDRASHVTAVDLEDKHVAILASRFSGEQVTTVLSEATAFVRATPEKYDLVIASGLLLFFDDDATTRLIEDIKAKLKPHGIIFIRDFVAHRKALALPSGIFEGSMLYYRTQSFYRSHGFSSFTTARPLHHFPKAEQAIFNVLSYAGYKAAWSRPAMALSWWRNPYANVLMTYEKPSA
jgi:2-polyprenyl-3-methyl-5-hydroxy-6-metoxy-1,4-benzoquinol methylase